VSSLFSDEEVRTVHPDRCSATSLGMMSDEEKKLQRIEDIRELLS
jgi:hypothetical protein